MECGNDYFLLLRHSLAKCNWKSVLFYSGQILLKIPNNFEALFGKGIALFCTSKFYELEDWMKSLPLDVMKNQHLLELRCKALQVQKDFLKIIILLGGDLVMQLVPPVLSIYEVDQIPSLKAIRQNAINNLSPTDFFPSETPSAESVPLRDPLCPESICKSIQLAMTTHQPQLLQKFTKISDHTTKSDDLLLTACGCYLYLMEQRDQGKAYVMKATEENPDCEFAWLSLLFMFTENLEWEQGFITLTKIGRRFPRSKMVSLFAISLCLKSGSVQLAWPWIKKEEIDDPYFRHEKAVAFFMDGEFSEAAAMFKSLIEQNGIENDILGSSYINLGHCFRRAGKFDDAIESYTNAIATNIRTSEVLASIGLTHQLMGNTDEAIYWLNSCLSVDKVHAFASKMLDVIFSIQEVRKCLVDV